MNYEPLYSDTAKRMRSSEIRELLELSQRPDVISFAGGLPNPDSFPIDDVRRILNKVLDEQGSRALQYGPTEGIKEFREVIAEFVSKDGIDASTENVLITSGSQQALDIISKIFLDKGDVIIVGLPTYLGGINSFLAYQASLEGVPVDENGMNVDMLVEKIEELRKKGKRIKMIYTIPTFQNPAGVEMSEERRKRLVEISEEYEIPVLEDDPYGKLRFEGEPLKPIKAFDDNGNTIYMATFSKILSPGIRLAYVVASKELIRKMVIAKQSMDLCTSTLTQLLGYHYIKEGYVDKQLPKIIDMYRKKRDLMLAAMEKYFPRECKWTKPRGGMFIWVECPEEVSTVEMFDEAVKNKVAYIQGRAFYVNGGGQNTMRLNFTNAQDEQIEEGIRRLGEVIRKRVK
ncbi:MAG: PLP-dependent aminotransferase family protein [Thermoplasmata archaeon]|nr:PLP-dependent aminotransferase family protein [Thermoplasmata archaeon]